MSTNVTRWTLLIFGHVLIWAAAGFAFGIAFNTLKWATGSPFFIENVLQSTAIFALGSVFTLAQAAWVSFRDKQSAQDDRSE